MDTMQRAYKENEEKARLALDEVRKQLEELLKKLRELAGDMQQEGGEQLVVVKGKAQELVGRCEKVLQDLLQKAKVYYEQATTEEQRVWVQGVLEKAKDQFHTTTRKLDKQNEKLSATLLVWRDEVAKTATTLRTSAETGLNTYSPSAYKSASEAANTLTAPLPLHQRLYTFILLIFQAIWALIMTPFTKKPSEKKSE